MRSPVNKSAVSTGDLQARRLASSHSTEGIEKRREGGRHPVGAIRPGISGLRSPTRICDESPLHHGLYPSFVFAYTVLARVSTQPPSILDEISTDLVLACEPETGNDLLASRMLIMGLRHLGRLRRAKTSFSV